MCGAAKRLIPPRYLAPVLRWWKRPAGTLQLSSQPLSCILKPVSLATPFDCQLCNVNSILFLPNRSCFDNAGTLVCTPPQLSCEA